MGLARPSGITCLRNGLALPDHITRFHDYASLLQVAHQNTEVTCRNQNVVAHIVWWLAAPGSFIRPFVFHIGDLAIARAVNNLMKNSILIIL